MMQPVGTDRKIYEQKAVEIASDPVSSAVDTITQLEYDPDFIAGIESHGVSYGSLQYSEALYSFASNFAQANADKMSPAETDRVLIMVGAPLASRYMSELEHTHDKQERYDIRHFLSSYNRMVEDFLKRDSSVTPKDLTRMLVEYTTIAMPDKSDLSGAVKNLDGIAKGVAVEIGSSQVFAHMSEQFGIEIRQSSPEEDLEGADFILSIPGRKAIKIDVKASLDQVAAKNQGYDINGSGATCFAVEKGYGDKLDQIVIYPLIPPSAFSESFELDKQKITDISTALSAQITRAINQLET